MGTSNELERTEYLRGIVQEHFSNVWRFLRRLGFPRHMADDAAQELFFVALRRIETVPRDKQRGFLFGAALRIATHLKRKDAREIAVDLEEVDEQPEDTSASPDERLDDEKARTILYRLLSEIEERFRVVFVMYEIEGMTMQEIAEVLEIPAGTVASRLRTARDDFAARLERHHARTRREGQ